MLQGRQPLALAPDECAQRLALVSDGDHVQAVRLAGLDLDRHVEVELGHQLFEDLLGGRHRLRRDLGRFGSLGVGRDAGSRDLGRGRERAI